MGHAAREITSQRLDKQLRAQRREPVVQSAGGVVGTNWFGALEDDVGYEGWGIAEQGGGGTPEGLTKLAEAMDKIFAS